MKQKPVIIAWHLKLVRQSWSVCNLDNGKEVGHDKQQSIKHQYFVDVCRKNVLQFLLISAHNQIQSKWVSKCNYYLPTLHGKVNRSSENDFQHMKLHHFFLYNPIKTATHSFSWCGEMTPLEKSVLISWKHHAEQDRKCTQEATFADDSEREHIYGAFLHKS